MQLFRVILSAAAVCAFAMSVVSPAQARPLRYTHSEHLVSNAPCGPVSPPSGLYIYPTANWEPFFRRRVYRFGPLVSCAPLHEATRVLSVRY
jgi:hypothetical protein